MCWGASQVALVVKNLRTNAGGTRDAGSGPGPGQPPGEWHGDPLQYSCLDNPMDRGACRPAIPRAEKNWTQLK